MLSAGEQKTIELEMNVDPSEPGMQHQRNGHCERQAATSGVRWRVDIGWYLLGLLGPTVLTLLLAAGWAGTPPLTAVTENWARFLTLIVPSLAFTFVLSNDAEEVGWTGFFCDRLQERHQPLLHRPLLGAVRARLRISSNATSHRDIDLRLTGKVPTTGGLVDRRRARSRRRPQGIRWAPSRLALRWNRLADVELG